MRLHMYERQDFISKSWHSRCFRLSSASNYLLIFGKDLWHFWIRYALKPLWQVWFTISWRFIDFCFIVAHSHLMLLGIYLEAEPSFKKWLWHFVIQRLVMSLNHTTTAFRFNALRSWIALLLLLHLLLLGEVPGITRSILKYALQMSIHCLL